MSASPKKTLVTGGAGFIGSHLAEGLLALGHEVNVVDNFARGSEANLESMRDNPSFKVHKADITDQDAIRPLFDGVDWVFHLAALADIVPSIQDPLSYHRANVDGTISVLEAARAGGVKRFVYASSSSCYGIPDDYPTPEDAAVRPMYPYALTKYVGEEYVRHWHRTYGMATVSLRLFNVYGPRSRTTGAYGAVFGVFLAQKLAGKPFTVVGDGAQSRHFTFLTDAARAFIMAAGSEVSGEVMNVGSNHTYTINRLVELLNGPVTHIPKRPGEPDCTFGRTDKIRDLLGWEPAVSFEDGVRRMLDNIEYWRQAPVWEAEGIEEATADWFRYLGPEKQG